MPNLLRIYKTNNSTGPLKAGDKIEFKITVDNDGNNDLKSLVVYDTLNGPDGKTISNKTYDLVDMKSRQEVIIKFSLAIDSTVKSGVYTTAAYAQGLNSSLQIVRSQSTATNIFTVGGTGFVDLSKATTTPESELKTATSTDDTLKGLTFGESGQVLGETCAQPTFMVDLRQGSRSNDVKALQVYLNNNGFALAKKGVGSSGNETILFGPLTKIALNKFQVAKGIKERGVFGAETRGVVNGLLNTTGAPLCEKRAEVKSVAVAEAPKSALAKVVKPATPKPASTKKVIKPTEASASKPTSAPTPAPEPKKSGFWSKLGGSLFK